MPDHLMAATMAHTVVGQWTAATGLSSLTFFWLGVLNVTMVAVFLSAARRRGRLARDQWQSGGELHDGTAGDAAPDTAEDAVLDMTPRTLPEQRSNVSARTLLSDVERDQATNLVCQAIAQGRLDIDEGMERVDRVLAARRRATVEPILADLPGDTSSTDTQSTQAGALVLRVVAAALVAGAVALQLLVGAWALWPVAVAALIPLAFSPHRDRPTVSRRASAGRAGGRPRRREAKQPGAA